MLGSDDSICGGVLSSLLTIICCWLWWWSSECCKRCSITSSNSSIVCRQPGNTHSQSPFCSEFWRRLAARKVLLLCMLSSYVNSAVYSESLWSDWGQNVKHGLCFLHPAPPLRPSSLLQENRFEYGLWYLNTCRCFTSALPDSRETSLTEWNLQDESETGGLVRLTQLYKITRCKKFLFPDSCAGLWTKSHWIWNLSLWI